MLIILWAFVIFRIILHTFSKKFSFVEPNTPPILYIERIIRMSKALELFKKDGTICNCVVYCKRSQYYQ